MKTLSFIIAASLTVSGCGSPTNSNEQQQSAGQSLDSGSFGKILTLSEAEMILGEPAHLADSATKMKGDTLEFKCTYTVNSKDKKIGNIYFMLERYARVESAKNAYSVIKTGNQSHEGFKMLEGVGDEAYFHTDSENFLFILVRKGDKMFRMKVSKITRTTSLEQFNLISKDIAAFL